MAIHLIITIIADDVCRWSFIHHHFAYGFLPVRFFTSLCCPVVTRLCTHNLALSTTPSSFVRAQSSYRSLTVRSVVRSKRQSYDFFSHFAFAFIRLCQSVFGWDFVINLFSSLFRNMFCRNERKFCGTLITFDVAAAIAATHSRILVGCFRMAIMVFVGFCVCFQRQRTSHTHIEIITQMWAEIWLCIVCCLFIDRRWLYLSTYWSTI